MAKKDKARKSKSEEPKSAPKSVDFNLDGNVDNSIIVVGDHAVVNYHAAISTNVEPHEPDCWNLKHPYPMPPNFTGRVAERTMLTQWLNDDSENRLCIIRALGGFGKSALTWYWLTHDVDSIQWPKVLWWSFYESDASFENFLKEALEYLSVGDVNKMSSHEQYLVLRNKLRQKPILIILDGFERALRVFNNMGAAYQGDEFEEDKIDKQDNDCGCVNPDADDFLRDVSAYGSSIKCKVLLTTRLTPRAVTSRGELLNGCRKEELKVMHKDDAIAFFYAQGIRGMHTEFEAACEPYGYHPLSLRILTGLIADDRETPGDVSAAKKLKIDGNVKANKKHVMEVAYNTLSPEQQKLLSNIACFRAPMNYAALKSIVVDRGEVDDGLDNNLKTLETRGLLHWDRKSNRYDLHPITRNYAYDRMTIRDRTAAHIRLRHYFAAVDVPQVLQALDDLTPVIELYHHTVQAGLLDTACDLFYERITKPTHYQFGAYQLRIELLNALFPNGEDQPPKLEEESDRAWVLNALANAYSLSGQPRRAVQLLEKQIAIRKKGGISKSVAVGLGNLAQQQLVIGSLKFSESNLQQNIDLDKKIRDKFWESVGHQELGYLYSYCGEWDKAEQEITVAITLQEEIGHVQAQSISWAYRTFCNILMFRNTTHSKVSNPKSIIGFAQYALELVEETKRTIMNVPKDFIRINWLLGIAYRLDRQLDIAEHHLREALMQSHAINLVEFEANILVDLARLRYDQKNCEEAKSLVDEALSITERCDYVLQGADVNLFLAQYTLEQEKDKVKAKEYAEEAKKLATCDGPPYYYKVAYEEAERMLEKLND